MLGIFIEVSEHKSFREIFTFIITIGVDIRGHEIFGYNV